MFAKTFCKPGAFLTVVPVGLRTTLQYNSNGLLEKVFVGYEETARTNVSDVMLPILKSSKLVPLTIPTKGGTTWVKGVFYTDKLFNTSGVLPMCIENDILEDMKTNPSSYRFYAGNVYSLAASFQAVMTIRNWLSMAKFEVLPGFIIPSNLTNEAFNRMVFTNRYPFKLPIFSGYMIYEGNKFRYLPLNMSQVVVTRVSRFNDENGYIKANLSTGSRDDNMTVQYTDVIKFNIHTNTLLVRNSKGKIMYSMTTDSKKRDKRSNKLTCSVCGKVFFAPESGPVTCDDEHCRSRLYPQVNHFLKTLNLPEMSSERFNALINSGDLICLTDVLLLDEYRELDIITTLDKLIQSVVPVEVCSDSTIFTMFANRCSNSVTTLKYYLDNPSRLVTDLNINSIFVRRLVKWLSDGYNITTLTTLIESSQVKLLSTFKKFDGAPIFRDKVILITGKFLHGELSDIVGILQSYEAKVVTQYEPGVHCLLVGGHMENIDGKVIHDAKSANIPIFGELEFFNQYGIDEDLETNLL